MAIQYQTIFGLRVKVGSKLWKFLLRNRLRILGRSPLLTRRQRIVKIATWAANQPDAATSYLFGGTPGIGAGTHTDCSGFVKAVYARVGITLGRTTWDQYGEAHSHPERSRLVPSDLIFFDYEGPHSHVGIFVGDGIYIGDQHTGSGIVHAPVDWSHYDGAGRFL